MSSAFSVAAEREQSSPTFPQEAFDRNLAVATWMAEYDRCARVTFDLVLRKGYATQAKLSPIWFCLHNDDRWWAAYGRMSDGGFVPAAVFEEFEPNRYTERVDIIDPRFENFGRALADAQRELPPVRRDLDVRSSFYVRAAGATIEVWVIPAYQSNGVIAYGSTVMFEYDSRGTQRLRKAVFGETMQGVRAKRDLDFVLPNFDQDVPTVGNIYLVLKYRRLFKSLTIETDHFSSTIVEADAGPRWQHTAW